MSAVVIVRCLHGLEWVAAAEVDRMISGSGVVRMRRREVVVDAERVGPAVLGLRCADDALVQVGTVSSVGTTKAALPDLAHGAARLDWSHALDAVRRVRDRTPGSAFDCVVSVEGKRSYSRFDAEAAVGRALVSRLGRRFVERRSGSPPTEVTDLTVRLFLRQDSASFTLRLGPRPLHRRAYKLDTGPGTLHPPLAAALVAVAGPLDGLTVLDPFCGDGTLAIEAGLASPSAHVTASDIDPERLANTAANSARAGVAVALSRADASRMGGRTADVLLTNPPWNVAVHAAGALRRALDDFWSGAAMLMGPSGKVCLVADADLDAPAELHRRGFTVALQPRLRVAGRIVHAVLAAGPGEDRPPLPLDLAAWRQEAMQGGVVTDTGF